MTQLGKFVTKKILLVALLIMGAQTIGLAQPYSFQTWNTGNEPTITVTAFRSVTIDKRGIVWAGSDLGGLYNFKDPTWKKIATYPDVTFRHMVPSNMPGDSNVWSTSIGKNAVQATTGGAYLINTASETVTQYGTGIAGGLGSRYANSLVLSSQGKTYVALAQSTTAGVTNQGGVYSTNTVNPPPPSNTSFTKSIPDLGDIVYHSSGNRGDELWFGRGANCSGPCQAPYIARLTSSGALLPPITASNSPLPFTNSNGSPFPRAIFTDTITGNTFVGLNTGGIGVCKPDGSWILLTSSNSPLPPTAAVNFNAIAEVYGEIWIGTNAGIFVYNGTGSLDAMTSFKMLTTADGLPNISITDIAVDTLRSYIWVTSPSGVSRALYTPPSIKGIVYNVFCNRPESTKDTLKLYDVLQKKPLVSNVQIRLLENGVEKENRTVNADGVFELTNAENGKLYTVEVKYENNGKIILYKYPNIKNHTLMGSILIPDSLIRELTAFKPNMIKRCFKLDMKFLLSIEVCRDEFGFNVSDYDKAWEPFYNINGIETGHKKQVENLADYYAALATVYSLGGISTDLMNESIKSAFDAVESLLAFVKLGKVVSNRTEALKAWNIAKIKVIKEGIVAAAKGAASLSSDPETKEILGKIITCIDDIYDLSIDVSDKGAGASPKMGMDILKKYVAINIAAYYYKTYAQDRHANFVMKAATSSKNADSDFPYDQTYNKLYSPTAASLQKAAVDTMAARKGTIENFNALAKYADLASEVLDAATALSFVPGGQLAGAIAKGLSLAAKVVKTFSLTAAMVEGAKGCLQVAIKSNLIVPTAGFISKQSHSYQSSSRYASQLTIDSLVIRKNNYTQTLLELKTIINNPSYDSAVYFTKYLQLAKQDSLYTVEMSKTLNGLWASADTAVAYIAGFPTKLSRVIDSFVTKQYTLRDAFYYQNLGFIYDTDKSGYIAELNSMVDDIKLLNDSAVNGLGYLATDITTNSIAAPAYLVQESYTLTHTHLPGSNGNVRYTFKNYGTEPQTNVSFKMSAPTSGYAITSADSVFIGTILGGETKEVNFAFTSPLTDSIGRYTIFVKATNGSFNNVTGSLYVNDPLKFYSVKDGNWSNPETWSSNTVPTATSVVVVSHKIVVDINTACKSLTSTLPGTVTVSAGKQLTVVE